MRRAMGSTVLTSFWDWSSQRLDLQVCSETHYFHITLTPASLLSSCIDQITDPVFDQQPLKSYSKCEPLCELAIQFPLSVVSCVWTIHDGISQSWPLMARAAVLPSP